MRIIRKNIKMNFISKIKIANKENWLQDIKFKKIQAKEEDLLQAAKEKLNTILSNINKNCVELYNEIRFGQFEFNYYVSKDGQIEIRIYLKQQTAGCDVCLDDDQWANYFHLPPYQVFHYDTDLEKEHHPLVRILSNWDDLQRLEHWIDNELEDWVLENFTKELKKKW